MDRDLSSSDNENNFASPLSSPTTSSTPPPTRTPTPTQSAPQTPTTQSSTPTSPTAPLPSPNREIPGDSLSNYRKSKRLLGNEDNFGTFRTGSPSLSNSHSHNHPTSIPLSPPPTATSSPLTIKEGWLWKQTHNFVSDWNRRYFVLQSDALYYYLTKKDCQKENEKISLSAMGGDLHLLRPKARARIPLLTANVRKPSSSKTEQAQRQFRLITLKKNFVFEAETPTERDDWLRIIGLVIQDNIMDSVNQASTLNLPTLLPSTMAITTATAMATATTSACSNDQLQLGAQQKHLQQQLNTESITCAISNITLSDKCPSPPASVVQLPSLPLSTCDARSPSASASALTIHPSASLLSPSTSVLPAPQQIPGGPALIEALCKGIPSLCFCADCGSPDPTWISINLALTICLSCSGVHRGLGSHISKVRSLELDNFLPETLALVRELGGNSRLNREVWESSLYDPSSAPIFLRRPSSKTPEQDPVRTKFIREKYLSKALMGGGSSSNGSNGGFGDNNNNNNINININNYSLKPALLELFCSIGSEKNCLLEMYKLIHLYGAEIDGLDQEMMTPLLRAAQSGNRLQMHFLILTGANTTHRDREGLGVEEHLSAHSPALLHWFNGVHGSSGGAGGGNGKSTNTTTTTTTKTTSDKGIDEMIERISRGLSKER